MSITEYAGVRTTPPAPQRSGAGLYVVAVIVCLLLFLTAVFLIQDAQAHIADIKEPLPACTVSPRHECTVQTGSGPVQVSMGYSGIVYSSTATAVPKP
jgi:hypothetical protein